MSDDYLVDKRGAVDPEVARLEGLLADARYQPGQLRMHSAPARRRWRVAPFAIAASLAAMTLAVLGVRTLLEPSLAVNRIAADDDRSSERLRVGSWLETDSRTRAELNVADVGEVDVAPGSRLRLDATGGSGHRLRLARGALHATIHAPPRVVSIDTPAATAVDLGTDYRLTVDGTGATTLFVSTGSVSLEGHGKQSTVWAGAECQALPGRGPGLPVRSAASPALHEAVHRFDHGVASGLDDILDAAEPEDGLTLWHLVQRTTGERRAAVLARLSEVVPTPDCREGHVEACLKALAK